MNPYKVKHLSPLLKSIHFEHLETQMTDLGIRCDTSITHEIREFECNEPDEDLQAKRLEYLKALAITRDSSLISINPTTHSCKNLLEIFTADKKGSSGINIKYGLPELFSDSWKRTLEEGNVDTEGQDLVLVVYEGNEPVGFQSFNCLIHHPDSVHSNSYDINVDLVLSYVLSAYRNKGYALDLSIGCGIVISDILYALYLAVPDSSIIKTSILADYESDGGVYMTRQIHSCVEGEVLGLRSSNERPSVELRDVQLHGCF